MPSPADIQASAPRMRGLFTKISGAYDRLNRTLSLGLDVLWRRRALSRLARVAQAPHIILDLATGTADFAIAAARRFRESSVIGVDLTPAMIDIGRRKIADAGLEGRVRLEEGDACSLECDGESVDAVLCAFGFRNFPDKASALREVSRVLVPGGHLLVLELFRPRWRFLGAVTSLWLRQVAFAFAGGAREEYSYLRESIGKTCSEGEFVHMADGAGLSCIKRNLFLPACSCLLFRKKYGKIEA